MNIIYDIQSDNSVDYHVMTISDGELRYGESCSELKRELFDKKYDPIIEWCDDNFNKEALDVFITDVGYFEFDYTGYEMWFIEKEDAMAFMLRWT